MSRHAFSRTARLMQAFFFGPVVVLIVAVLACAPAFAVNRKDVKVWVSDGMDIIRRSGDMCTLTFDDGPSRYSGKLLDILKSYNVPATFFVVGTQVEHYKSVVRRMVAEGHEVGNHSYSHGTLRNQSPETQQADLLRLDSLLRGLGVAPRFIRPPYGIYDHNTINIVQEMNGHIVMWSVDSQDWRQPDELENILENMELLYEGAPMRGVFLFHDTHRLTVERMPQIIEALAASGCRFVTLSEYIDGPASPNGPPVPVDVPVGVPADVPMNVQADDPVLVTPELQDSSPTPIFQPAPADPGMRETPPYEAKKENSLPGSVPMRGAIPVTTGQMEYSLTLPAPPNSQPAHGAAGSAAQHGENRPAPRSYPLPGAVPAMQGERDMLERILDSLMPQ